jgi:hypothetical protein
VGSPPSRSFKLLDQLGFDETDFVPLTEGRQTRRRPVLKRSEIDHKRLALVQRKVRDPHPSLRKLPPPSPAHETRVQRKEGCIRCLLSDVGIV